MLNLRIRKSLLVVILSFLMAACSGEESVDAREFDLAEYLFHENLKNIGGEISYVDNHYEKPSGNGPVYSPINRYVSTEAGIDWVSGAGVIFTRDIINENSIVTEGVSFDSIETIKRFARIGDVYADVATESTTFKETCSLEGHFESFDIAAATAPATIVEAVYEDVIQVFCDSTFDTEDGGTRPNYSWDQYYARGVGLIFVDGSWTNLDLGDIYGIPEY